MSAPMTATTVVSPAARFTCSAVGALLVTGFFGLTETPSGLRIGFHPLWSWSTAGELYFWLAAALMLFPAGALLGFAWHDVLGAMLRRTARALTHDAPNRRTRIVVALGFAILVALVSRAGHTVFFRDFPFTDDEWAVRFGGDVLATGHLTAPAPEPAAAFPHLYTMVRNGRIASFDFPGGLVAACLADHAHLGQGLYAALSGLTTGALVLLVAGRLGLAWGVVAGTFFLFSPMCVLLSSTRHVHVLSRCAIAVALWLHERAAVRDAVRSYVPAGLAMGLGFFCRPVETTLLLLPLVLGHVWDSVRGDARARRAVAGLVAGAIGPIALFLAYDYALTGDPFVMPRQRGAGSYTEPAQTTGARLWRRFGTNVAYNFIQLAVWFLGPLGWMLVPPGISQSKFTQRLALGFALLLSVGMLHPDSGVHLVGPIHSSECVVPLIVLAVHGLARVVSRLRALGVARDPWVVAAFGAVAVTGPVMIGWHGAALRDQARAHELLYEYVSQPELANSVLLAPRYEDTWNALPSFHRLGTWVFEWRRPRPDLSDPVLIVRDAPGNEEALRTRFPTRAFFRLRTVPQEPYLVIDRLPANPPPN